MKGSKPSLAAIRGTIKEVAEGNEELLRSIRRLPSY